MTSVDDLSRIIAVQQAIATSGRGLEDLMTLICEQALSLIPTSGAAVELAEGEDMVYRALVGFEGAYRSLRLKREGSLSGLAVKTGEVLESKDTEADPRVDLAACRRLGVRAMICVPLIHGVRPVGVLKMISKTPNRFGARDLQVLRLFAGLLSAVLNQAGADAEKTSALKRLSESERTLRTLVDTAFESVIVSKNGVITQTNPRARQMFGLEVEAGIALTDLVAPFERERVAANVANNYSEFYEFVGQHLNGMTFPVEGRGYSLEVDGELWRISTLRDVSERKRGEESLRRSEAASREAVRVKSEFMANMSHEIRTPLNGVMGLADLLAATELSPEQREYARLIRASADTLLRLVNDILDFSKLEANRLALEILPFSVAVLVDEVTTPALATAGAKDVALNVSADYALPLLLGDPTRLRQVLENLVSNAVKFTIRGKVDVSTRLVTRDESGYHLRFEVVDTGIGIPADAIPRLFQPFSQIDASMSRRFGGSGLGLSISKQIIGMMGGEIDVTSQEGVGSTFWFTVTLPAADRPGPRPARTPAVAPTVPAKRHLLIAEDNPINQLIAVKMIEKMGHRATAVKNGREALEEIGRETFDLILMDCQMPEMDGFEATREIRTRLGGGPTIVAMTANAMPDDRERCLGAGMNDYLAKPINFDALRRVVNRWTERKSE